MTQIEAEKTTFTRIAEVWIPEGDRLVHGGGAYAGAEGLRDVSGGMSFAKGEGLPGKAWAEARPVVLKEFDGSYFKRAEAAKEAGLTCAVAVPVFAGTTLKAVLVILCGDDAEHYGAIEVWQDAGRKLTLADGYFGTAKDFEAISRDLSFTYGQGLPGSVWASATPILMRNLPSQGAFLRAEAAGAIGLKNGIGVPVPVPGDQTYVLTLLSSENTPIARRFEIWDARPQVVGTEKKALRMDGFCAIQGPLWPKENPPTDAVSVSAWHGPVGKALGSGLPQVHTGSTGLPEGYDMMVALPVYKDAELAYVVVWYP